MIRIDTIRQGQRVAVWDKQGRVRLVDGPQRLLTFGCKIDTLPHYCAHADQYVVIQYIDGHCEHLPGPIDVWFDPVLHQAIYVKEALHLNSNEAIVIYRRTNGEVERRVQRGPAMFVPHEDEWLHEFRWHGADPKNSQRKIPHALFFEKLRVIPDQMYHHVEDVRTADDALLTIKTMVFFELNDIEQMLDQTHDPIADFINAITADVIDFVATRTFEQFKQETDHLNELRTYSNLMLRAERIGYRINKVVYRGYMAGNTLQSKCTTEQLKQEPN